MADLAVFLKRAGWRSSAAGWSARDGRRYFVFEEAAPGNWDRSSVPFLAKAILQARAAVPKHFEAVAALKVKQATPLSDARLAAFVDEVAPGQSWILFDDQGRVFPHVGSADELLQVAANQVVRSMRSPSKKTSLFTDLHQWLLKVMLAPSLPEKWLHAPREQSLRNASMLAHVANVSLPVVTRFLRALEAEGHLETRFGDLRVSRPLDLLTKWRDRIGQSARQEVGVVSVRGAFDLKVMAAFRGVGARSEHAPDEVILGLHSACEALGLGFVSGATPVGWIQSLSPRELEKLGLIIDTSDRPDLLLRVPRYRETILRGAVSVNGSAPATDVIQCWLDTSHSRVRGEEQADFLWRKALKPAFS